MNDLKLTYFDIDASRGEECRLALHLAGLPFDDVRVDFAGWQALKPTTPYGALPILEVAGRGTLAQSNAILTFIGRAHGLLPSDPWEAARHEAILCACEELRSAFGPALREKDPERKRALREEFVSTTLQTWAGNIAAQLGEGPFFGGADPGVADIKVYIVARWFVSGVLDHVPRASLDAFPTLTSHLEAVAAHPGVRAWTTRRR